MQEKTLMLPATRFQLRCVVEKGVASPDKMEFIDSLSEAMAVKLIHLAVLVIAF